MWFQGIPKDKIHLEAQQIAEVVFQFDEAEEAGNRVKGHEQIQIAVGTMLAAENPGNIRQGASITHIRERLKGQ